MAYSIKFIKNPPSEQELIAFYESDFYKQLFADITKKANETKIYDKSDKQIISQHIKRRYLILNIPMEEVISELKEHRESFLDFCIEKNNFYKGQEDDCLDGEFPEEKNLMRKKNQKL